MTHHHVGGPPRLSHVLVALNTGKPKTTIVAGDLLSVDASGYAVPASAFAWDTDLATTRAAFVVAFIGLSAGNSTAASEDPRELEVPVLKDGDEVCDVASATYKFGDLLGPKKAAGNALVNTLEGVATIDEATHMSLQTMTSAVTALRCEVITKAKRF